MRTYGGYICPAELCPQPPSVGATASDSTALLTVGMARLVPTVVACACAYEAIAILMHTVPTISALQRRHRLLGLLVTGWLAYHFLTYPEATS
jgi:hypothetical protein